MTDMSVEQWKAKAAALAIRSQAFIDGRFVDAVSGKTFSCINPATGALLAEVAEGDQADIDLAVRAARRAFEDDCVAPPALMRELSERLGGPSTLIEIPTLYGHDAFLKESFAVSQWLKDVLGNDAITE